MKPTEKFLWTCTFLFAGFLSSPAITLGGGETLVPEAVHDPGGMRIELQVENRTGNPFSYPDSLFNSYEFRAASMEYEYAGFFSESKMMRTEALLRKSECLKQMQLFEEAELTLGRLNYEDLPDTLVYRGHFQSALCSYLAGNFSNAESHLLQLNYFLHDTLLTRTSLPLFALVLNELEKWPEARSKLLLAVQQASIPASVKDSLTANINDLYKKKNLPHKKNLTKALIFSSILPGTGQIYAGYFWDGIASLLFNAATISFVGYNIATKYYFTTGSSLTNIFHMFYSGGLNRVDFLIKKKNYLILRTFNDQAKAKILGMTRLQPEK